MKSLHFTFNGWATLFWFPILCKPLQNMNLLRYNIFSQLQQKKAKKSTPTGSTLFGFVLDNCSSDQVLQSWDRRRCFSKRWLQDAAGKFSMPKGPNAERDEHRGWWAPATHPPFGCVYLFAIFLCSNLYKFARKNTFVCKSSLSMWEWWVVISCWLIYCIYFLKFACQRWVLETLETFCRRYALTSENLHRKPTEAKNSDGISWSWTPTIFSPSYQSCGLLLTGWGVEGCQSSVFLEFLSWKQMDFCLKMNGNVWRFFWLLFNKYTQHHNKNWIAYNRFHFWIAIHQRGFYFFILA